MGLRLSELLRHELEDVLGGGDGVFCGYCTRRSEGRYSGNAFRIPSGDVVFVNPYTLIEKLGEGWVDLLA